MYLFLRSSTDRSLLIVRLISQMSIVPLVFRDWWDDIDRPVSRLLDQHFGTGLHRDDLISNFTGLGFNRAPLRSILGNTYYRPWRNVARQNSSGSSTIQLDNDNFQVGI
jgi:crystallin alpha B